MHRPGPIAAAIAASAIAAFLIAAPTVASAAPAATGGTLTGLLVDHTGAPLVGATVTVVSDGAAYVTSVPTDGAGRYTFTGVPAGRDFLQTHAIAGSGATPDPDRVRIWEARAADGVTTAIPTVLVHSSYDLFVTLLTTRTDEPISGATIRAHDTATGATYDERTPFTVGSDHDVMWEIPSGRYTIELITKATATHPVEHWWFTDPSGTGDLTKNAGDAVVVPVHLDGNEAFLTGTLAR